MCLFVNPHVKKGIVLPTVLLEIMYKEKRRIAVVFLYLTDLNTHKVFNEFLDFHAEDTGFRVYWVVEFFS